MELIEIVISANEFLEGYFIFRGFRFIMGTVLVILGLNIILLWYVLVIRDKYYREFSLGHIIPNIVNTMKGRWNRVQRAVKSGNITQQKEAIVESGNMLYEILEKIGYEGNTLGEQLDGMEEKQLENIDDLKKASVIKDRVVNDNSYELSNEVILETVRAFGEALAEHETISKVGI